MGTAIKNIIKKIQFETEETLEQIANKISYSRQHLMKLRDAKEDSEDVLKLLNKEYNDILQNVTKNKENYKEKYETLLEKHNEFLQKLVEKKLDVIQSSLNLGMNNQIATATMQDAVNEELLNCWGKQIGEKNLPSIVRNRGVANLQKVFELNNKQL